MKVHLTKLPKGVSVEGEEISLADTVLLCLEAYVNIVKVLLEKHPADCHCDEMAFHKEVLGAMSNIVSKKDNKEKILEQMFKNFGKEEDGKSSKI